VKLTNLGLALSILGALLIAISQAGTVVLLMTGRIIAALRAVGCRRACGRGCTSLAIRS
jgi:hypothetical protein